MNGEPLHSVHVLSGDLWAGAEVSAFHLIAELAARPGIRVEAVVLNAETLHDRLRERSIPVHVIDENRHGFGALVRQLTRILRESRPQIVHSHRYKEHLISTVAARRCGAVHLRSAHGRPASTLGSWADRVVASLAGSNWIAVSEDLAAATRGFGRRVTVVPNGIPERGPAPDRAGLEREFGAGPAWWIGFIGRFETVKRPDRFVRLIGALPETIAGRPLRALMIGDGSLYEQTVREIAAAGLQQRITLAGWREDAERLLPALDLLVLPSDHEGDPMILLEAMRAGVPVAASRVGSLRRFGDVPWVTPRGDEQALERAVRTLLESESKRNGWAAALHEQFLRDGTITRSADRVLHLYREFLAHRSSAGLEETSR